MFATTLIWAAPSPTPTPSYDVNGTLKTAINNLKGAGDVAKSAVGGILQSTGLDDTVNSWPAFLHRVTSDWVRLVFCLLIVLAVVKAIMTIKGNDTLKVAGGIVAGIAAAWVSWQFYNSLTGKHTPLFIGEPSFGSITSSVHSTGPMIWAAIIGIIIGVVVAIKSKGLLMPLVAGILTWIGVVLIYDLWLVHIFSQ